MSIIRCKECERVIDTEYEDVENDVCVDCLFDKFENSATPKEYMRTIRKVQRRIVKTLFK